MKRRSNGNKFANSDDKSTGPKSSGVLASGKSKRVAHLLATTAMMNTLTNIEAAAMKSMADGEKKGE